MSNEVKKIIRYTIVGGLFMALLLFLHLRSRQREEDYNFSGIVQEIKIDDQGIPKVVVNRKVYFLGFPNREFNENIQIGDSLIKRDNSSVYKLVEHQTGKVILSK